MTFRLRYSVEGGHTHVRVFAGKSGCTLGKCGDLVFRNEEWTAFVEEINGTFIEVLPEGKAS